MKSLQEHIEEKLGLSVTGVRQVRGGDISHAWCFETAHQRFFLKVNDASRYPEMFQKEARGLQALRNASALAVPEVADVGEVESTQYLLLKWLEKGHSKDDFWEAFGTGLAFQHQQEQSFFGWVEDNYIGSLPQCNTQQKSWGIFFAECRIMPLIKKMLEAKAFTMNNVAAAEKLCRRIDDLFPPEPPALLHGDLWGGNYAVGADGYPWVFDPAVYCGHREMDIGMTQLFGGFDKRFLKAYHLAYPLAPGWERRMPVAQLYPLLVHGILFGGHYVGAALSVIKQFA